MAESFIGKWKVDLDSTTGLDEFGAAMGFSAEHIEAYRKFLYTVEFSKSGDTITATVTLGSDAIPAQSYSFKLGETFVFIDAIDGTKPNLTITFEDGKFLEKYKLEDKEWQTVREVADGVMTSTTSYKGKSVVQKLNKQ